MCMYTKMDDKALDYLDEGMGTSPHDKSARRFQISHRIFRRLAKNNDEATAFAKFFEMEWKKDPTFIISMMGILCGEVDCDAIMEGIEEQKDNNKIDDNTYLIYCNTTKTIHDYQSSNPETLLPQFFVHRIRSS